MNPIKDNAKYLAIASLLFLVGMLLGVIAGFSGGANGSNSIIEELEPLFQFYKPYQPFTVVFLFFKNLLTAGMAFILSPLIVVPAAILLINGYLLGMVGTIVTNEVSLWAALAALLPHGIFEMPALVIAAAAGFRFGIAVLKKIKSKIRRNEFSVSNDFEKSLRLFVLSAILLFAAAIMETYVTPMFMGISP
ncbi:MAG: stage II sporulation protein M [Candidatus Methanosuratincola petrocarbonis]